MSKHSGVSGRDWGQTTTGGESRHDLDSPPAQKVPVHLQGTGVQDEKAARLMVHQYHQISPRQEEFNQIPV